MSPSPRRGRGRLRPPAPWRKEVSCVNAIGAGESEGALAHEVVLVFLADQKLIRADLRETALLVEAVGTRVVLVHSQPHPDGASQPGAVDGCRDQGRRHPRAVMPRQNV